MRGHVSLHDWHAILANRAGKSIQDERFFRNIHKYKALNEGKPDLGRSGFLEEGQLKERSEGVQAQWQTALGVVMAAGS